MIVDWLGSSSHLRYLRTIKILMANPVRHLICYRGDGCKYSLRVMTLERIRTTYLTGTLGVVVALAGLEVVLGGEFED